jgi:hypothetical protein
VPQNFISHFRHFTFGHLLQRANLLFSLTPFWFYTLCPCTREKEEIRERERESERKKRERERQGSNNRQIAVTVIIIMAHFRCASNMRALGLLLFVIAIGKLFDNNVASNKQSDS